MARADLGPDLTIRGAGIFGLSIGWVAARRGARVRVIDPFGVGSGSSGGVVGALAPHVPEKWNPKKAFQLDSLLMAAGWWAEVEATSGRDAGYARTGRLQPLADARAVEQARERAASAEALWQGHAAWLVEPAPGGWSVQSPTGLIVRDTLTARINPRRALAALTEAIRAKGGEVIVGEAEASGPVIWATGAAGLGDLSAVLGVTVGDAEKGQAIVLGHDAGRDAPQLFADTVHIVPHADGTVAIGSTTERQWDDATTTDAQLDTLLARAIAACPVLEGAPVLERWAGLRPRARSRAPMLGEWPGRPSHFIANGGFKIGFGMAPKVAEVMADLVLEGRYAIPDGFRVEASLQG
ncbi:MAG: FAD-dependent oxidoreductase [Cereibacter sphaeroides]|uniref:FAD-dependent oxidoreductase n=1 Tax=Cereibacter sphaeroides TaxID=1063 RepID=A0A2W5SDB6_CERSP|nr:MAG: FAD-dependent oxidoreductase [Cereibacter sphaeroides]